MNWLKKLLGMEAPKPEPADAVSIRKISDSLYEIRIRGVLHKGALDRSESLVERDLAKGTSDLKALIILDNFKGWRKGDNWGDLDFFIRHGNAKISKIAVVGEAKWKDETLIFLLAGKRQGEVRYYTPGDEHQARAWLDQ